MIVLMPKKVTKSLALAVILIAVITGCAAESDAIELVSPVSISESQIEEARGDLPEIYDGLCYLSYADVAPADCKFGEENSTKRVFLVGDSHAAQWAPAIIPIAEKHGWNLSVHAKAGCTFSDNDHSDNRDSPYPECARWVDSVVHEITAERPDLVIISGYARHPVYSGGTILQGNENEEELAAGMVRTWSKVQDVGAKIVVIADTPYIGFNSPNCLLENMDNEFACVTDWETAVVGEPRPELTAMSKLPSIELVDLNDKICFVNGNCGAIDGDLVVWRDLHHLSASFAATLSAPLEAQFEEVGAMS